MQEYFVERRRAVPREGAAIRAFIVSRTGVSAGTERAIDEQLTIGRGNENDLVLEGSRASARHARVLWDDRAQCFFLEDLDSTNGTKLDGMPVRGKVRLESVHVLTFADEHEFFFVPGAAMRRAAGAASVSKPAAAVVPSNAVSSSKVPLSATPPSAVPSNPPVPAARPPASTVLDPGGGIVLPPVRRDTSAPGNAPPAERREETVHAREIPPVVLPASGRVPSDTPPLPAAARVPAEFPVLPASGRWPAGVDKAIPMAPAPAGTAATRAEAVEPNVVPSPYRLEVRSPGSSAQLHPLRLGANRIGRLPTSDVVISHETVSREHAVLFVEPQRVLLRNLSKASRTTVNGVDIQEVEISRGTPILFGDVEAILI